MRASAACSRLRSRSAPASSGALPTSSAGCTPAGSRSRPCWSSRSSPGSCCWRRRRRVTGAFDAHAFEIGPRRRGVRRRRHRRLLPRPGDGHDQHRLAGQRVRGARAGRCWPWPQGERPGALALAGSAIALCGCGARVGARVLRRPPRRAQLGRCWRRPPRSASAASSTSSATPSAAGTRCRRSWAGAAHRSPCSWPGRSLTRSSMRLRALGHPDGRRHRPARRRRERALRGGGPDRLPVGRLRARLGVPGRHGHPRPDAPARARLAAAEGGHRAGARGRRHRQRELEPMQAKDPQNG